MLWAMLKVLYSLAPAYAADVAPVLAKRFLQPLATPMDGGRTFRGRPIFGSHKTWRGLIVGVAAGAAAYEVQVFFYVAEWLRPFAVLDYARHPLLPGLLMGFGAIGGDAVKSLYKRQMGIEPGSSWLVFDQLDFFFGASLLLWFVQPLPFFTWIAVLPIVFACDIAICALACWLGLKEDWI